MLATTVLLENADRLSQRRLHRTSSGARGKRDLATWRRRFGGLRVLEPEEDIAPRAWTWREWIFGRWCEK